MCRKVTIVQRLRTMHPQSADWHRTREGPRSLSAPRRRRGEEGWEGERRCTLDKHRHSQQAKGAARLGPQGPWSGDKDSPVPGHGHARSRWTERAYPLRRWRRRHRATPYASRAGNVSRKASRQACGQGRREEAHAILSWEGEGWRPQALSPHAQAGRRPSGLASPESLAHLSRRASR